MRLCTDPTCTCRTHLPHHITHDTMTSSELKSAERTSPESSPLPRAEEHVHRMLQRALVESVLTWIDPSVQDHLPLSGPEMRAMKEHAQRLRAFRNEWKKKGVVF